MWIVIYQSSGIDVHSGITGLSSMVKSVIAMKEIKKVNMDDEFEFGNDETEKYKDLLDSINNNDNTDER